MYPLVRELAADGIPVAVTSRVLQTARQPYYRWLACPVTDAEVLLRVYAKCVDGDDQIALRRIEDAFRDPE